MSFVFKRKRKTEGEKRGLPLPQLLDRHAIKVAVRKKTQEFQFTLIFALIHSVAGLNAMYDF